MDRRGVGGVCALLVFQYQMTMLDMFGYTWTAGVFNYGNYESELAWQGKIWQFAVLNYVCVQ